jgi:polyisoprenoid-binding protein YceI
MNATHRICAAALTLCLGAALAGTAVADTLTGDLDHSSSEFVATHLTISSVHGTIPVKSWSATTGAGDIPTSVTATLDAQGLDTKSADRDHDLHGADWFDVTKYPTITFKSTSVVPGQNGAFKLIGDLTIHGVTKPVTLDGKVVGSIVDGHGHRHVGYTATTTIDRRDFGLTWGHTTPAGVYIVGNDVTITINAEGIVTN